eukprot:4015434-Amphidinium_carterae.1
MDQNNVRESSMSSSAKSVSFWHSHIISFSIDSVLSISGILDKMACLDSCTSGSPPSDLSCGVSHSCVATMNAKRASSDRLNLASGKLAPNALNMLW